MRKLNKLNIVRNLTKLKNPFCSHADDSSRAAAAGCLGCLVHWLPAEEQVFSDLAQHRKDLNHFLVRAQSSRRPFCKMTPHLTGLSGMEGTCHQDVPLRNFSVHSIYNLRSACLFVMLSTSPSLLHSDDSPYTAKVITTMLRS